MSIPGHVQNGVIVLDGKRTLPEGAAVVVSYQGMPTIQKAAPTDKDFDIFAEMRGLMVDVTEMDDSREAIYSLMERE